VPHFTTVININFHISLPLFAGIPYRPVLRSLDNASRSTTESRLKGMVIHVLQLMLI
jgi:hypothetical protein